MQHLGTKIIETGRLTLRPLSFDDCEMMYANWAGDDEITKYLRWDTHRNWTVTAEYLNEVGKHYKQHDFYDWGICVRSTGVLIGNVSIFRADKEPPSAWHFGKVELLGEAWEAGYIIGRKWQNEGYATEALCAVRDYWFNKVGGIWLTCCHANENVASGAVMQKAGFRYDHNAVYHRFNGTPVDCRVYYLQK